MNRERAKQIVDIIIDDLAGRRALRQAWESIDDEIQAEVREHWTGLVLALALEGDDDDGERD